jgi:hypothetical protein
MILLQQAEFGGGPSQAVFGGRCPASFLDKVTILATSITLTLRGRGGLPQRDQRDKRARAHAACAHHAADSAQGDAAG